jgi:hypothetical protein
MFTSQRSYLPEHFRRDQPVRACPDRSVAFALGAERADGR